jgi:hypothetical protein
VSAGASSAEYLSLQKELEDLKRLYQAEKTEHIKTKKALAEVRHDYDSGVLFVMLNCRSLKR